MNLAINYLLRLFTLCVCCSALLFSLPVLALDTDGDGISNYKDADDDGDDVPDSKDPWPLDIRYSKDTDSDGMPDRWETLNGLNPNVSDASSDKDADNLTALREFILGTSIKQSDTDHDSLSDGWEANNNRNPAVADYQASAGVNFTCALDENEVHCWGYNGFGQLDVPPLSNPTQVSAGTNHACALHDGGAECWGFDYAGTVSKTPELSRPTQISAGYQHSCALDDNGVHCWGGMNTFSERTVPKNLFHPTQVSVGNNYQCVLHQDAISKNAKVECVGRNNFNQTDVPDKLSNPTQISAGAAHACALHDSGMDTDGNGTTETEVKCWGSNEDGQRTIPILSNPTQISAGDRHTCALHDSGKDTDGNGTTETEIKCWGAIPAVTKGPNPKLFNPAQVSVGKSHACAMNSNSVRCWGLNLEKEIDVPKGINFDPDLDLKPSLLDAFRLDPAASVDTDGDGKPNTWNLGKTAADSS